MKPTPIFNPKGSDEVADRRIWQGNTTNLMQLNNVRYPWAVGLWRQMRENFWVAEKIDITQDVTDYENLTPEERRAYNSILAYLTFLDSVQTCNLPHIKSRVTAPEVSLCLSEQISQEALHNQSYQYLIETIIPSDRRNDVYEAWRSDEVLKERCEYIAGIYQLFVDSPSPDRYFDVLVANYLLEGIYFYNGFIFFYNLASRHLMAGSADVFRMIHRDELSHVRLFQKLIPEAMATLPFSVDRIHEMFHWAVTYECLWVNHIVGDGVLGITQDSTEQYTKYLANMRLKTIGVPLLYEDKKYKKSPYTHLEKFADTKGGAHTKANFFEASVTSYVMASAIGGWDEF